MSGGYTLDILTNIGMNSSRTAKEAILRAEINNTTLQQAFYFAYNSLLQYYVVKLLPTRNHPGVSSVSLLTAMKALLPALAERRKTGNAALEFIRETMETLSKSDAEVLSRVIQRDLRCGVEVSTVNKIWPKLIPVYPVLLAEPDSKEARAKIKFPAFAQLKCDGMRINAVVKNGVVNYFSRAGKPVAANSPALDSTFVNMAAAAGGDFVFDGELLGIQNGLAMERKVGNGIANKAMRGTILDAEKDLLGIVLWDIIPYADFEKARLDMPYEQRWEYLQHLFDTQDWGDRVFKVTSRKVNNWGEAEAFYNEMIAKGLEGLIIKNSHHIWEDKRSADLVKMKLVIEGEFEVVQQVVGQGKYADTLGALVCKDKHGKVEFNVGTGLTDDQRREFWKNPIVGKIITCEYNGIIQDKDRPGVKSLYLPVFIRVRYDKSEADDLQV